MLMLMRKYEQHKTKKQVCFSAYVAGVFLCLCLCARENQPLEITLCVLEVVSVFH